MTWQSWLLLTILSSAAVGAAVRHFTKSAIEHAFHVKLEKVKFDHAIKLQEMSERADQNLEYVKSEIALFTSKNEVGNDSRKEIYLHAARVRAVSFPRLVSLLRRMKRQFEGLYVATQAENGGPIDLREETKRSKLARQAHEELEILEKDFDNELSTVRLFTQRSDYSLQQYVQSFSTRWRDDNPAFSVSESSIRWIIQCYNDDISSIADDLYKPLIDTPQSGEWLGLMAGLHFHEGIEHELNETKKRERPDS